MAVESSDDEGGSEHELVSEEDLLRSYGGARGARKRVRSVPRPGRLIDGKYLVERVHRPGLHGVTIEAEHVHLQRRVVLKLDRPARSSNSRFRTRSLELARSLARVQSEHLARLIDYGSLDSGASYIVSEYLSGTDLRCVLLVRERLPVAEAVDYVRQACRGLIAAAGAGLVHGNLKPSNLFLAREEDSRICIKVLDFENHEGAASVSSSSQGESFMLDSLRYLAPEQIRGSRTLDGRVDVWALGVILYELLTGVRPFDAPSAPSLSAAIAADEPRAVREIRVDVPLELERIVLRCLEKSRTARFADARVLADQLEEFAPEAQPGGQLSHEHSSAFDRAVYSSKVEAPELDQAAVTELTTVKQEPAPTPRWLPVAIVAVALLGCSACLATYLALQNIRATLAERAPAPRPVVASLSPAVPAVQPSEPAGSSLAAGASSPRTDPPKAVPPPIRRTAVAPPRVQRAAPTPYDDDFSEPDVLAAAKHASPVAPAPLLFDEAN